MGVFPSEKVHSSVLPPSSSRSAPPRTMWQTMIPLLFMLTLATALPAGPQKRQAYYFSPSSIYSNPYFGYTSYPGPIPYSSPSYSPRVMMQSQGSPYYSGPYASGPISGEPIQPPPPGSYQGMPPAYSQPQYYQPQAPADDFSHVQPQHIQVQHAQAQHAQAQQIPALHIRSPQSSFNGGLLLVPIRDETIGGSGGEGSGTDYFTILSNYLTQWVGSKPQSKPEKPPVGEKPTTETGSGIKGENPDKVEKPEGEAETKPTGEKAAAEAQPETPAPSEPAKEQPAPPPVQRYLIITPPQLMGNPQDPAAKGTYLILNSQPPQQPLNQPPQQAYDQPPQQPFNLAPQQPFNLPPQQPFNQPPQQSFNTAQQRFFNPYQQPQTQSPHVFRTASAPTVNFPSAQIPSNAQQPAARSAFPEYILGKNDNKYGFIHPTIPDLVRSREDIAIPGPERHAYGYPQFYHKRRAFEDYFHADSVSVESAAKDASNAAQEDAATTSQPAAGGSTNSTGDEEVVESGEIGPSIAQVKPAAIALAGPGGVAAASPVGTALVGPGGMALAAPSATAVAGPSGSTPAVAPAAASAFASPTTYRKQVKHRMPADAVDFDVDLQS